MIASFAAFTVALTSTTSAGVAGLLLNYAFRATQSLSFAIRSSTAMDNMFNSPERVLEYINMEHEEEEEESDINGNHNNNNSTAATAADAAVSMPLEDVELTAMSSASSSSLITNNNNRIILQVNNLYAKYNNNAPNILNGIQLTVKAGELIGICGRTGCGKSTLALVLVGGMKCITGDIILCDKQYKEYFNLAVYRKRIQLFPQDCYIIAGTLREVLDPVHKYTDEN